MANAYTKYLGAEDKHQRAVIEYLQLAYPFSLYVHVPNEGRRTKFEQFKFKYLGGKRGIPDLLIFNAKGKYNGLAIELKVGYNKPTPNQKKWLEDLERCGWLATWSKSFDQTKEIIDNYFKQ